MYLFYKKKHKINKPKSNEGTEWDSRMCDTSEYTLLYSFDFGNMLRLYLFKIKLNQQDGKGEKTKC